VVRLLGWGHDSSDKLYWIAANSFGEQWGENGDISVIKFDSNLILGIFKVDTSLLESFGLEYETGLL
jgi:hypothetical protein